MNQIVTTEGPTGLEKLQAIFARGGPGIGRTLGFRLHTLEAGFVVFEGEPNESVYNPIGTVHGGYAATLLDSAGALTQSALALHQQVVGFLETVRVQAA